MIITLDRGKNPRRKSDFLDRKVQGELNRHAVSNWSMFGWWGRGRDPTSEPVSNLRWCLVWFRCGNSSFGFHSEICWLTYTVNGGGNLLRFIKAVAAAL